MTRPQATIEVADADRIPSEFRYWANVDAPMFQRGRRVWRRVFGFDPQPPDEYVRRFARAYYDSDPVAEAFVDEVYLGGPGPKAGRKMLDQALESGIDSVPDAPESMRRLFAEFETFPAWYDADAVALGAKVFRRWGPSVFAFATTSTLEMYSESSIAKPLSYSGG